MTWAKDHNTLIKYILLLWGKMTHQSATFRATQARHYRNVSATFKRHRTTSASRIFVLRKSPDIWAKWRVARSHTIPKSENSRRTTLIYVMLRVILSHKLGILANF